MHHTSYQFRPSPLDARGMCCPCGARAEQTGSLCRKCQARANWLRRRTRRSWRRRLPKAIQRAYAEIAARVDQEVNQW